MGYSTNVNTAYFRANFLDEITYDIVDTNGMLNSFTELDPFSLDIHLLVDSLQRFTTVKWTGQQLTTLVYATYGNTTLIWLVLMCNGMLSRTELRMGMILKFPFLADINAWIAQNIVTTNSIGNTLLI
jgi:hypothetical protein